MPAVPPPPCRDGWVLGPGRVAAQHSSKKKERKILHYLHSDVLCVNTPADNSGFHDVTCVTLSIDAGGSKSSLFTTTWDNEIWLHVPSHGWFEKKLWNAMGVSREIALRLLFEEEISTSRVTRGATFARVTN